MDRFWTKLKKTAPNISLSWMLYGDEVTIGSESCSLVLKNLNFASREVHIYKIDNKLFVKKLSKKGTLIIDGRHLKFNETVSINPYFIMMLNNFIFETQYYSQDDNFEESLLFLKKSTNPIISIKKHGSPHWNEIISLPHEGRILVGREEDCDIIIDDTSISRYHLDILIDNGVITVENLNIKNKVLLNNIPLKTKKTWKHNDIIRVGASFLRY